MLVVSVSMKYEPVCNFIRQSATYEHKCTVNVNFN